jgi:hypothetical protein
MSKASSNNGPLQQSIQPSVGECMLKRQVEWWIKAYGGFMPHSKIQRGLGLAQVASEGYASHGHLPTTNGHSAGILGSSFPKWELSACVDPMPATPGENHPDQERKTRPVE